MSWLLFALLAALCWGMAPVFEKMGLVKLNPYIAVTIRSVAISVILLVSLPFSGQMSQLSKVDFKSWVYIIIGGILAGLLGQALYFYALKSGESSRVVPIAGTYPLVAAVLGISLLGEAVTFSKIAGVVLIVAGIFLVR